MIRKHFKRRKEELYERFDEKNPNPNVLRIRQEFQELEEVEGKKEEGEESGTEETTEEEEINIV